MYYASNLCKALVWKYCFIIYRGWGGGGGGRLGGRGIEKNLDKSNISREQILVRYTS